jgi:hypothetical protein
MRTCTRAPPSIPLVLNVRNRNPRPAAIRQTGTGRRRVPAEKQSSGYVIHRIKEGAAGSFASPGRVFEKIKYTDALTSLKR